MTDAIMHDQPIINIGMIGSVSNGKSSLVERLTGKRTQQHSSELKNDITIKLGYANAKIYACKTCKAPQKYQPHPSDVIDPPCNLCGNETILRTHVSFVDCPGHNQLMATMLNGTCVMDSSILVTCAKTTKFPADQTKEHMLAGKILGLRNDIVVLNKLDRVTQEEATERIKQLKKYTKNTIAEKSPIVPTVANLGINRDVICEYIAEQIDIPNKDLSAEVKMIIIRSFNVNMKKNISVSEMLGGAVGGTILRGTLRIGDRIEILPGVIKSGNETVWAYQPLYAHVESIRSEKNPLKQAIPGGLIGVGLTLDPGLTAQDGLVGNVLRVANENESNYKVWEVLRVFIELFREHKINRGDILNINHNACDIRARVTRISKSGERGEFTMIDKPICAEVNDYITISRFVDKSTIQLIGRAQIVEGDQCQRA